MVIPIYIGGHVFFNSSKATPWPPWLWASHTLLFLLGASIRASPRSTESNDWMARQASRSYMKCLNHPVTSIPSLHNVVPNCFSMDWSECNLEVLGASIYDGRSWFNACFFQLVLTRPKNMRVISTNHPFCMVTTPPQKKKRFWWSNMPSKMRKWMKMKS